MSDSLPPATLGLVCLAAGLCWSLTACARVVARRIGMLDRPDDDRKCHRQPIPLLGGVALYLAMSATVGCAIAGQQRWVTGPMGTERLIGLLLLSAGLFCLLGLWDDRRSIRPRTKFLLQIAATLPFVVWGQSVELIHLLGVELNLGLLGIPFTVFWLVACANIINLVDGLDGLAGTIVLIVTAAIMVHSEMQGLPAAAAFSLILCGSLIGFLPHNWPPAKIFLGDSGSLMLGFLIGALSIESSMKTTTGFALAIPLVMVSVPVFDTAMAIVRRKLTGRGIGEADREHIHHRLLERGWTQTQSLLAISGICLVMAVVSLVSASFQSDWLALGVCLLLLFLLVFGRIFGDHETLLFVRTVRTKSLWLADSWKTIRPGFRLYDAFARNWLRQSLPRPDADGQSSEFSSETTLSRETPFTHEPQEAGASGLGSASVPIQPQPPGEPIESQDWPITERRVA